MENQANKDDDDPLLDIEEEQNKNHAVDTAECDRRQRISYCLKRKLEVAQFAKKYSNNAAAKKYSIGIFFHLRQAKPPQKRQTWRGTKYASEWLISNCGG